MLVVASAKRGFWIHAKVLRIPLGCRGMAE
jgi:hypothetical protein